MFNYFTKMYLNSNYSILQWNKRMKSAILELWYTLSIFFPFLIILMIPSMILKNPMDTTLAWPDLLSIIPFNIMMIVMINKDFFNGQSVVHRRLGYQVIDVQTQMPAGKIKCMLRNITAPIWPIEVFFFLASPKRRLGDFIAGTSLIEVQTTDPELILHEIENASFDDETKTTLAISIIFTIVYLLIFDPRMRPW